MLRPVLLYVINAEWHALRIILFQGCAMPVITESFPFSVKAATKKTRSEQGQSSGIILSSKAQGLNSSKSDIFCHNLKKDRKQTLVLE